MRDRQVVSIDDKRAEREFSRLLATQAEENRKRHENERLQIKAVILAALMFAAIVLLGQA